MNAKQITGAAHGSMRGYMTGFILSVILTAIPFAVVMSGAFSVTIALMTIAITAIVQIVVHLNYFLHLNEGSDKQWNLPVFIFAAVIIGILVVGSLWIMHNLNVNMMPQ